MVNFATLEQRVNSACIQHLSNCTASVGAVSGISGVFDKHYSDFSGMVAGSKPVLKVLESDVPNVAEDQSVTISGEAASFKVSGEPQRDGTGMVMLILREV